MLEDLYLQATNYIPDLDTTAKLKEELKILIDTKKEELRLYVEELNALKEKEAELLEGLKDEMECKGLEGLDLGDYKISLVDARLSVKVGDINECDRRFVRVKEEPNKREALKHYKDTGILPEGFSLVKGQKSLRITKRAEEEQDESNDI